MAITIQADNGTVLLVDLSYMVFYRYFATFNWYKRQANADIDVDNIIHNVVFMEKYCKMFEKAINDLVKTYKVTLTSNIVFVKDCSRENIWRHKHYNAYKASRDDKSKVFNKEVFAYTYNVLLPQMKDKIGFQIVGHYCLEADDVIAVITNELLDRKTDNIMNIVVITNDNDYIQLLNHKRIMEGDRVTLCVRNLQDKNICDRVGCSPKDYINVKKIIGDVSDNIPSIIKKCGKVTAFKLATNQNALSALLAKDPIAKQQYELNDLLVDFDNIPLEYVQDVKEKIQIM